MSYFVDDGSLDHQIIQFIAEKSESNRQFSIGQLVNDFIENSGSKVKEKTVENRLYFLRKIINKLDCIEKEKKIQMMFVVGSPIDDDLLKEMEIDAEVTLDASRRIEKYKKNGGGLVLGGSNDNAKRIHQTSKNAHCDRITEELMTYLAEKTAKASKPIIGIDVILEFEKSKGYKEDKTFWKNRMQSIKKRIHQYPMFSEETKVRMLFALSVGVNETFLEKLRLNATVAIDNDFKIVRYQANDGSLELEGDQSISNRAKEVLKKRRIENLNTNLEMAAKPETIGLSSRFASSSDKNSSNFKQDSCDISENLDGLKLEPLNLSVQKNPISKNKARIMVKQETMENEGEDLIDKKPVMVSTKVFIQMIMMMLNSLNSSILAEIKFKTENLLAKGEATNWYIPIDTIATALEVALRFVEISTTIPSDRNEYVLTKDFLLLLDSSIKFSSQEIDELKKKMKSLGAQMEREEKRLQIIIIRHILDSFLTIATTR